MGWDARHDLSRCGRGFFLYCLSHCRFSRVRSRVVSKAPCKGRRHRHLHTEISAWPCLRWQERRANRSNKKKRHEIAEANCYRRSSGGQRAASVCSSGCRAENNPGRPSPRPESTNQSASVRTINGDPSRDVASLDSVFHPSTGIYVSLTEPAGPVSLWIAAGDAAQP